MNRQPRRDTACTRPLRGSARPGRVSQGVTAEPAAPAGASAGAASRRTARRQGAGPRSLGREAGSDRLDAAGAVAVRPGPALRDVSIRRARPAYAGRFAHGAWTAPRLACRADRRTRGAGAHGSAPPSCRGGPSAAGCGPCPSPSATSSGTVPIRLTPAGPGARVAGSLVLNHEEGGERNIGGRRGCERVGRAPRCTGACRGLRGQWTRRCEHRSQADVPPGRPPGPSRDGPVTSSSRACRRLARCRTAESGPDRCRLDDRT